MCEEIKKIMKDWNKPKDNLISISSSSLGSNQPPKTNKLQSMKHALMLLDRVP